MLTTLVATLVAVWVVRSRNDGPDRVRHVLGWSGCTSVERHDDVSPSYARHWTGVRDRSYLICQSLGPHVFYAQFQSGAARAWGIAASPPADPYCLYAADRIVAYTGVDPSERVRTCDDLKGALQVASQRG